ncbi:MAG TPA: 1-(5-phosphoribosyl)-5-[(5-phosphoribosylamino)methylideneamino]imidazole-4-carboxamide isomerase [Nitrospirae bacterium]|nr:1-(5-phosphoribosyl)-5-[(5-phosphoribosylamino) methylideneamino] imidazole-4-carboxamide isomerase [bacterium BMS3Bbin09]HDN95112.1 1-(5-phosphoribosyl)-5-[(5-phosphoribosylamino)methylideneamino]imidazole-4-carboxamide isomerase [Nitrospirota bacterium]HDO67383.1 1-(5-phosphoribosyl)-5-[(5-phosphoribosylamino)methylideneamino]imidazole-4-carboxamide isomerase [Nitrospirota bacterium]HEW81557.1 1-(5-phosphoribosyl)-5-[(5-phosphoribosylamino)methylideneamino]imidazole-4-carboxamide isomerase 
MIIIPAIDLKDGKCVRLLQGKKDEVTVYSDDPAEMAKKWVDMGARLLHVVDLDGAFSGEQKNIEKIKEIRKAIQIPIQLGGGIRDIKRIEQLADIGVDRMILGTSAAKDPDMVARACKKFECRVLVGIDAKDGKVAVKGWVEVTELDAIKFAKDMESAGAAGIIYTDISRDGMMTGPNIEAMAKMVKNVKIPVIASGGVSKLEDIKNLMQIKDLWGVITGKALYSGALDLKSAIELTREA